MLVCAIVWLTSCSIDDNPAIDPADGPGVAYRAVAEAIFGPSLREGVTYTKEHLSRKQIVPKIIEILQ